MFLSGYVGKFLDPRLPGGHVRLRHGGRLWWCRFATPRRRPDLSFFTQVRCKNHCLLMGVDTFTSMYIVFFLGGAYIYI